MTCATLPYAIGGFAFGWILGAFINRLVKRGRERHGRMTYPVYPASQAIADVLAERDRQQDGEGWTPEHDDEHRNGELARAAGAYCESAARPKLFSRVSGAAFTVPLVWPRGWSLDWWKPKDPRRDLVRAAALIIAEIERIDRAARLTSFLTKKLGAPATRVFPGCGPKDGSRQPPASGRDAAE